MALHGRRGVGGILGPDRGGDFAMRVEGLLRSAGLCQ